MASWRHAAPSHPVVRGARAVRDQRLHAAAGRARRGPVGRPAPGPVPAHRNPRRDLGDHRGRAGAAAVDPAAAAARPRHAVQRDPDRGGHRRGPGPGPATALAAGAGRGDGIRGGPERRGDRSVHRRGPRARAARRADDRLRGPRPLAARGAHRDRGHGAAGGLAARRHGRRGHRGLRGLYRTAGPHLRAPVQPDRSRGRGRPGQRRPGQRRPRQRRPGGAAELRGRASVRTGNAALRRRRRRGRRAAPCVRSWP